MKQQISIQQIMIHLIGLILVTSQPIQAWSSQGPETQLDAIFDEAKGEFFDNRQSNTGETFPQGRIESGRPGEDHERKRGNTLSF